MIVFIASKFVIIIVNRNEKRLNDVNGILMLDVGFKSGNRYDKTYNTRDKKMHNPLDYV